MVDYGQLLKVNGRDYLENLCEQAKKGNQAVKYARIVKALEGDPNGVDVKLFRRGLIEIDRAGDKSRISRNRNSQSPSKLEKSANPLEIGKKLQEIYNCSNLHHYPKPIRDLLKKEGVAEISFGGKKWRIAQAPNSVVCDYARKLMNNYEDSSNNYL